MKHMLESYKERLTTAKACFSFTSFNLKLSTKDEILTVSRLIIWSTDTQSWHRVHRIVHDTVDLLQSLTTANCSLSRSSPAGSSSASWSVLRHRSNHASQSSCNILMIPGRGRMSCDHYSYVSPGYCFFYSVFSFPCPEEFAVSF